MSNLENIPLELRERPQWVLWKRVTRGDKPTKIPYQTNGKPASTTNPATWATFDQVVAAGNKSYAGLGYVFTKDDPYIGVDLDNCRNPETGELAPWAKSLLESFDSYAEVSPSKTGVKTWLRGTLPPGETGRRTSYENGAVEIYGSGRYFAVTGQTLGAATIAERPRELASLWGRLFGTAPAATMEAANSVGATPSAIETARARLAELPDSISGEQGHDKLFRAACEILRHGIDGAEGRDLLDWFNLEKCEPPWNARELDHKWKSAQSHVMRGREFGALAPAATGGVVGGETVKYRLLSCAELDAGRFEFTPLIKGALIAKQNCIIAGPSKTYKTSLAADAGISLATGTPFLGHFEIPATRRVLFMAGEIGESGIQDYARRICTARKLELAAIENLYWSTDLPKFGSKAHLDALEAAIVCYEIEVLILDPLYLAMPGADAGNLMVVGGLLRSIGDICHGCGCTPIFLHHTVKAAARGEGELGLHQIAWAGFGEWARQWWLVQPLERWRDGKTTLRLNIGGSTGVAADVAVGIDEGTVTDETPVRLWETTVTPIDAAAAAAKTKTKAEKTEADDRKLADDMGRIRTALLEGGRRLTRSARSIRVTAALGAPRVAALLELMVENGELEEMAPASKNAKVAYRLADPQEFGLIGSDSVSNQSNQ